MSIRTEHLLTQFQSLDEMGPVYRAAYSAYLQLQNVESRLSQYSFECQRLDGPIVIERKSQLDLETFLRSYYSKNRPVILTDAVAEWPALTKWTLEYLRKKFGAVEVEVTANRLENPLYEREVELHKTTMRFRDFLDRLEEERETNDYYLVANNHLLKNEHLKPLFEDLSPSPALFSRHLHGENTFLFLGPAGTITPLHHDTLNVFLTQIFGRKLIRMIPAYDLPFVCNEVGVFSEVDIANPNFEQHPEFLQATILDIVLGPGETLFIPVGWWHWVKALDISLSINTDPPVIPNQYKFPSLTQ